MIMFFITPAIVLYVGERLIEVILGHVLRKIHFHVCSNLQERTVSDAPVDIYLVLNKPEL